MSRPPKKLAPGLGEHTREEGECVEVDGQKIAVGIFKVVRSVFDALIPLCRAGPVKEAARAILFFASPLSDYLSGQVLAVLGGLSI
jgi:3-oxoacyl-[acyl-carrier protein] reductase